MTREEIQKTYSCLSNNELLCIVDNKHQYTEMAVLVALEEIAKRDISEDELKAYKDFQISLFANTIRKHILDDLTLFQKNLFFFIWIPFLHFAIKQNFREDGFVLKERQATYYSLFGFLSLIIIMFISVSLDLSSVTSLALWILTFLPTFGYDEYYNREQQISKIKGMLHKNNEQSDND